MKSSDEVERIVEQARLEADQMTDARILRDADKALVESAQSRPPTSRPGPTIWRTIMESKATRYSAAAVIALAAALVLLSPFGTSRNGSVVLADVVDKIREMPTVIIQEKYLFWEMDQGQPYLEADATKLIVTKYASEEHGVVEHVFDDNGTLTHQVFWLEKTGQFMIVAHAEKKYIELSIPEDTFDVINGILSAHALVEHFTSGQYTELGRGTLDGLDVEGFETADRSVLFPIPEPIRSAFPVTDIVGRMWIDVESYLPVGAEAQFDTGRGIFTGLKKLHAEWRASDFQWNAEIPHGLFDPNIPDDYTEFTITDLLPPEAKAGLVGLGTLPVIGIVVYRRRRRRSRRCLPIGT
jgi:hypothetical protein